jgi:hypothetical protein
MNVGWTEDRSLTDEALSMVLVISVFAEVNMSISPTQPTLPIIAVRTEPNAPVNPAERQPNRGQL